MPPPLLPPLLRPLLGGERPLLQGVDAAQLRRQRLVHQPERGKNGRKAVKKENEKNPKPREMAPKSYRCRCSSPLPRKAAATTSTRKLAAQRAAVVSSTSCGGKQRAN